MRGDVYGKGGDPIHGRRLPDGMLTPSYTPGSASILQPGAGLLSRNCNNGNGGQPIPYQRQGSNESGKGSYSSDKEMGGIGNNGLCNGVGGGGGGGAISVANPIALCNRYLSCASRLLYLFSGLQSLTLSLCYLTRLHFVLWGSFYCLFGFAYSDYSHLWALVIILFFLSLFEPIQSLALMGISFAFVMNTLNYVGSLSAFSKLVCWVNGSLSWLFRNHLRAVSPSCAQRSPSPSRSPLQQPQQQHGPGQWQKRLLLRGSGGERASSPTRSISPRPIPISPLVQRRISAGQHLPAPFFNQARNGWVTPIGSLSHWQSGLVPRSRSLDTGLSHDTKLDEDHNAPSLNIQAAIPDTSDSEHDDVLESPQRVEPPPIRPNTLLTKSPSPPLVFVQQPSPTAERPSRRDRTPVVRTKSKAAQTIVAAINQAAGGRKTPRRSTTADDESPEATTPTGSAKFVDRCVTKMKTLINKWI